MYPKDALHNADIRVYSFFNLIVTEIVTTSSMLVLVSLLHIRHSVGLMSSDRVWELAGFWLTGLSSVTPWVVSSFPVTVCKIAYRAPEY